MDHHQEQLKDSSSSAEVGIVGAGFAGLTLANFCEKHKIAYKIFQARDDNESFVGDLDLPSAPRIWKELGLQEPASSLIARNKIDDSRQTFRIPRDAALNALRQKVNIQFSTRIVGLTEEQDGAYLIDQKGLKWGPYTIIAAADGVKSVFRSDPKILSYTPSSLIGLVGDSRWVSDRWWDLGSKRRSQGADIAMNDAIAFGELLLHIFNNRISTSANHKINFGKFCAKQKYTEIMRRQFCVHFIAIPMLIAIITSLYV